MAFDTAPLQTAGDLSIAALDGLFGTDWFSMNPQVAEGATIIVDMLSLLNEFALFAMGLLFCIVYGTAVVGTAHEGEPLGKKLHSFWVPVRFALATGMLAPISGGLCLFQLLLLMTVGWSVHGANELWNIFLDSALKNDIISVSTSTDTIPPSVAVQSRKVADDVLMNLALISYQEQEHGLGEGRLAQLETPSSFSLGTPHYRWKFLDAATMVGDHSKLGGVDMTCYTTSSCNQSVQAVQKLILDLQPIAETLVARGLNRTSGMPDDTLYNNAVNEFARAQTEVIRQTYAEQIQRLNGNVETFLDGAKKAGWIGAGSYYHTILSLQSQAKELSRLHISSTAPNLAAKDDGFGIYANSMRLASSFTENVDTESIIQAAKAGGTMTVIEMLFGENLNVKAIKSLSSSLAEGDPIHGMAAYGNDIIAAAIGAKTAFDLLKASAAAIGAGADAHLLGKAANWLTGVPAATSAFVNSLLESLSPLVLLLVGALFAAGVLLAFYIPAVPFVIWLSGVIGWLLLVVESLVAAPLWIVGHALPEGEGFAGEHGRRGYMLFLGILVRPFLMLMGLCCAMVLINTVGRLIAIMVTTYVASWEAHASGWIVPIISLIAYVLILGALMILMSHKTFSLIVRLPDNVLAWVGGHMAGLGEEADEGKANIMMGGMVRRTESAIQGSTTMQGKRAGAGQQEAAGQQTEMSKAAQTDTLNQKLAPADKEGV